MFRLSLSTFRERWQLFLGSLVTVGIGVALVQSSLLILITAASFEAPSGMPALARARLQESYVTAISLVGITLALAVFLTVFIVSSTFAFTVAQRRRDLALLRLTGGSRRQLRRLLLSEATLLGLVGTALGIPFGLLVMQWQSGLLVSFGFLPAGFSPQWQGWILAVSVGVGLGVALAGVLVSSRRAGRVRPLDALRGAGGATRVLTPSRWFFGVLFLAGAIAMMIIAKVAGPSAAIPLTMLVALAAAVGLSALSPLVVPVFARVLGLLLRTRPVGTVAAANLRDGVRRSAATAAPLIVLVGILAGLFGTALSITEASERALRRDTAADFVATTPVRDANRIAEVPGVATTSVEVAVPLVLTLPEHDEDESGTALGHARVIDPAAYRRAHSVQAVSGSLDGLRGHTVAVGAGRSGEPGFSLGDTLHVRIGDRELNLPIVAVLPGQVSGGPDLLLPSGITPEPVLTSTTAQTVVSTATGADRAAVGDRIRASVHGTVDSAEKWVQQRAEAEQSTQLSIFTIIAGMAGLYALFAVINAVVIAAADRRAEFAAARLSGLTRGQVVRMAVLESATVTATGVLLGGVAAAGTLLGIRGALQRATGFGVVELPWPAVGALVTGAFLVVGLTSLWTARSATRRNPISLVGAD
ncbi:FtsX-like permease family protein [Amycolatopsis aidingensis]|uniref:FtsX-like permease family protein n=1 Tax=Amycolatopsis aidingensis TaxID=2842453 RepID=UPI001C0CA877|nr:FtsX-like permease family protein [Amycolatopsis aidingensis]